jgi:hypothetical protein
VGASDEVGENLRGSHIKPSATKKLAVEEHEPFSEPIRSVFADSHRPAPRMMGNCLDAHPSGFSKRHFLIGTNG